MLGTVAAIPLSITRIANLEVQWGSRQGQIIVVRTVGNSRIPYNTVRGNGFINITKLDHMVMHIRVSRAAYATYTWMKQFLNWKERKVNIWTIDGLPQPKKE